MLAQLLGLSSQIGATDYYGLGQRVVLVASSGLLVNSDIGLPPLNDESNIYGTVNQLILAKVTITCCVYSSSRRSLLPFSQWTPSLYRPSV